MGEFTFCHLCKCNHQDGRRHLYSKSHQSRLSAVIDKYKTGLQRYRVHLSDPLPLESVLQQPTFWCRFCEKEVKPCYSSEDRQYFASHIFQHIADPQHSECVENFFRTNKGDIKLKSQLILSSKDLKKYERKVRLKNKQFDDAEQKQQNDGEKQKNEQYQYELQLAEIPPETTVQSSVLPDRYLGTTAPQLYSKRVNEGVMARKDEEEGEEEDIDLFNASHLTRVKIPQVQGVGNVFTPGSIPPWLQDDDSGTSVSSSREIGPPVEAFLRAKKMEMKRKLNPKRVGATIDRELPVGKNWLPNFGRVWNAGSRRVTRLEFLEEQQQKEERNPGKGKERKL
ncbi:uncharacterized protein VTP21DRAFT_616 [Calcarisporiella thermophila]|uniref:uncharacterized protein n=1 Tax=Calcarisporiella thermophila TaxID=911321 RepID=UPI003743DB85